MTLNLCFMFLYDTGNGFIPTSSLKEILATLDDQLTNDQLCGNFANFLTFL